MNFRINIPLLVLVFVVFQTTEVLACDHKTEESQIVWTLTESSAQLVDLKACCDSESNTHENKGCKGSCCDASACHCPTTLTISVVKEHQETLQTNLNITFKNTIWTYNESLPKSVAFSIWTPPKIS